jgi:threonine synthase
MHYYSTNRKIAPVSLSEAVIKGLAADNGLFMPERIEGFPEAYFRNIHKLSFREIAADVACRFFGEDMNADTLREIVFETLSFDCPIVQVKPGIYALELFHGPTLAFKDVGARFMARLLRHFLKHEGRMVNVLVATSGDTGSAVANGFLGVEGIRVFVLYPKGKVSEIQEKQFTTLGNNITALEIDGTFDDCQLLVKTAFLDEQLNTEMVLTSANSINVARFLPQAFYYFNAYARLQALGTGAEKSLIFSVPSGNFGNLTAGLFAREMGLPVKRFIAANNANDVVYEYLKTGKYLPRPSVETLANAMDVGTPSNFDRILDLYGHSYKKISSIIKGYRYSDDQIRSVIRSVYQETGYMSDPHGACGIAALQEDLKPGETGIFLETAHPAKFTENMESILDTVKISIPEKLEAFLQRERVFSGLSADYADFRNKLLTYKP